MTLKQFKTLTVGDRILVHNLTSKTDEWATVTTSPYDGGTMVGAKFDNLQQQPSAPGVQPGKTYGVYFRDVNVTR